MLVTVKSGLCFDENMSFKEDLDNSCEESLAVIDFIFFSEMITN